jgi:formylglycine-generating enzyme required for sulfatase activity
LLQRLDFPLPSDANTGNDRNMQTRLLLSAVVSLFLLMLRAEAGRQALATATVTSGQVSGVIVVDGGDGYPLPPLVMFVGGGGTGATAVAVLTGTSVSSVVVTATGDGYSSTPAVSIASPPASIEPAVLQIDTVPRLTITGMRGTTNAVQWSDDLISPGQWNLLTNVLLGDQPTVILDTTAPAGVRRLYRVVTTNGEPAGRPPGFVWIPPGRFIMGSPLGEDGRFASHEIQHPVVITRGFWISRTETTAGQYGDVMKRNPGALTDPRFPAARMTWRDATNYCHLVTQAEAAAGRLPPGFIYRLPTEAEWEYAARAGTETTFSFGNNPLDLPKYGWGPDMPTNSLQFVGSLLPNPWGLFDVHGNAAEWCLDAGPIPYPLWEQTDPFPNASSFRAVRGGAVRDTTSRSGFGPLALRSASRLWLSERTVDNQDFFVIGFRAVLGTPILPTDTN